jgi:hypothetical protein
MNKRPLNETHTGQSMIKSTIMSKTLHQEVPTSDIPQFFFPNGKPIDSQAELNNKTAINTIIG